ncbi:hypothetical protein DVH24_039350 [Malus domestica]|uniref:Uncharacterized protein n=1 Tax=Malus domestica TaxID=3750 RepID=A0A498I2I6_MALDO|nr:hypothetical protein DVH24_039350 [Malus domestica]
MPFRFLNKQSCRGSGSRDLESSASSIFEKAIMLRSALKWWSMVSGKLMLRVKIADKLYPSKSGSRSSKSGASSVFKQAILSGIWLSRFRERNPVGSLTLEIRRAVPLRFLSKQILSEEIWLSKFEERCLFGF